MKRFSSVVLLLLFICTSVLRAQMLLPKPDPPRAVNDFAGVLNPSQNEALESKLRAFTDSTSNAIVVVIVIIIIFVFFLVIIVVVIVVFPLSSH